MSIDFGGGAPSTSLSAERLEPAGGSGALPVSLIIKHRLKLNIGWFTDSFTFVFGFHRMGWLQLLNELEIVLLQLCQWNALLPLQCVQL